MKNEQLTNRAANETTDLHSDTLLEAVSACITNILTAESVKATLPQALQTIANTVHIDRMMVMEVKAVLDGTLAPAIFFVWESSEASPRVNLGAVMSGPYRSVLEEWM